MALDKEKDEKYMRRCIQIARGGLLTAKPNPSVGAVIVSQDGRIIGEGFTSAYGGPHAEVNAFASVRKDDEALLRDATVYVSLEPCSHWGKTPPCCDLIIRKGVRRVVCGCVDPFAKVQGRGIRKMREAGITVDVGVLEEECRESNKRFFTFNTRQRPFIILKWAQSVDGYLDDNFRPTAFSTPFTTMLVHKLRAENDAILVGRTTALRDNPQLNVREWCGRSPVRIVLSKDREFTSRFLSSHPDNWHCFPSISETLRYLYDNGKQSLIVEGGASTLQSFIDAGLWDVIRIETAPRLTFGGTQAPKLPHVEGDERVRTSCKQYDGNTILTYERQI